MGQKEISLDITATLQDSCKTVSLNLAKDDMADWCASLALLRFNMIKYLKVKGANGFVLSIEKYQSDKELTRRSRFEGQVREVDGGMVMTIGESVLGGLLAYCLISYRDGQHMLDHMSFDVPVSNPKVDYHHFDFVMQVPRV